MLDRLFQLRARCVPVSYASTGRVTSGREPGSGHCSHGDRRDDIDPTQPALQKGSCGSHRQQTFRLSCICVTATEQKS